MGEALAALDIADRDARASRLFVVAAQLALHGDEVAVAEARIFLAQAWDDGSPYAAFELAMLFLAGRGGPVDTAEGLRWLERAAATLPVAAVTLGGALLLDPETAAEGVGWLRRAAAAGEAGAFWLLGAAQLRGLGGRADPAGGRMLIKAAAEQGIAEAQLELAQLYAAGIGGARDEAAAVRWERVAAESGNAVACLRVAQREAARPGGVALAIPWFERAAAAGSPEAAADLAALYLKGEDVPYEPDVAERWMSRARELGWSFEIR
ncbi:MAG: tetratricopeptide repeat family protein [Myxococcales bacterium]|nr:tetratricopeptide repeat family protein [Myxococcales bacterium]